METQNTKICALDKYLGLFLNERVWKALSMTSPVKMDALEIPCFASLEKIKTNWFPIEISTRRVWREKFLSKLLKEKEKEKAKISTKGTSNICVPTKMSKQCDLSYRNKPKSVTCFLVWKMTQTRKTQLRGERTHHRERIHFQNTAADKHSWLCQRKSGSGRLKIYWDCFEDQKKRWEQLITPVHRSFPQRQAMSPAMCLLLPPNLP